MKPAFFLTERARKGASESLHAGRAYLDTTTMPLVDSPSPRRRSGERVRERGFQLAAPSRWKVPLSPALSPLVPRREREWGASSCAPVRIKKTYGFDFANVFRHVPSLGKEVLNVIVRGW